jgi:alpha/beta superfamily hydrolase
MSSSTAEMFKAMIRDAEDNVAALQDQIDTNLPPSPQLLQTLHNLQHMFRGNIDKLKDSIAELR